MRSIAKAQAFAALAHKGQNRKYSDQPYTAHLEAVVATLREHGLEQPDVLAAAYLHDTIEKTDTTFSDIVREFGEPITRLVYWLTDAEEGNRLIRSMLISWRLGRAPMEAKLIKLADIIDNCANVTRNDPDRALTFCTEKLLVLAEMQAVEGDRLTNLDLFQLAHFTASVP